MFIKQSVGKSSHSQLYFFRLKVWKAPLTRIKDCELKPSVFLFVCNLGFDGVTLPERHRHKLADRPIPGVDPVQPSLVWNDHVVLTVRTNLEV